MKLHRIMAIVKRHFLLSFRRFNGLFSVVYWPFINIVIWGITSVWIQKLSQEPLIATMILTGLVLWQIVFRVNLEIAKGLYEELLNQNVVNLFSTPLTWGEWVAAMMILGVINMVLVLITSGTAVWYLYGISILKLGWNLLPFMISLLLSGWFIGFFICGILINWGLKAKDFLYTIGYLFSPFSAVFYPLAALPSGVQSISKWLPMTAIFEAMRQLIQTGSYDSKYLITSFVLNILYLGISLLFFWTLFEKSRTHGLGRLE